MKRVALLFAALLAYAGLAFAAVNINSATREQLEALDGIGPVKAQAIIDYRKKNGSFKRLDEIKNVDGIGDATFEKIRRDIALTGTTTMPKPAEAPKAEPKPAPAPKAADKAPKAAPKADEKKAKSADEKKAEAKAKADAKKAEAKAKADEKKKAADDKKKAADAKKGDAKDAKKDAKKDEEKKK